MSVALAKRSERFWTMFELRYAVGYAGILVIVKHYRFSAFHDAVERRLRFWLMKTVFRLAKDAGAKV